ncbi:MAG: MEDS domain-containing protein [Candidatus Bathyarchaeia archaeon]
MCEGKFTMRTASILKNKNIIQNALLGDHNVYFYPSPTEKHWVLFSNLKAGLDNRCSVLYIASMESIERVQLEMESFGLSPDNCAKLKIVTSNQWYTPDGQFKADRVVEQYRSLIDESLDKGFEGLYVSADVAETFDYLSKNLTPWLKYENSFGRTFKFPMEAICAYRTDQIKLNGQALLQLLQAHKSTITSKTANFLDNQKLYIDAVTKEFDNIFGEEVTKIIFHYLERLLKIPRNQIPDKIEVFNKALESIFGDVATILNQKVLKNLHGKIELE